MWRLEDEKSPGKYASQCKWSVHIPLWIFIRTYKILYNIFYYLDTHILVIHYILVRAQSQKWPFRSNDRSKLTKRWQKCILPAVELVWEGEEVKWNPLRRTYWSTSKQCKYIWNICLSGLWRWFQQELLRESLAM